LTLPKDIERGVEQAAHDKLRQQNRLQQTLSVGVNGPPELRRGERSAYLGQFPEQVLKAATKQAVSGKTVPEQLIKALSDPRCQHVYLSAAHMDVAGPIMRLAKQHGLRLTVVQAPDLRGDTAVVLTTNQPHDENDLWVR
jgi:uncharacterized protein YueI